MKLTVTRTHSDKVMLPLQPQVKLLDQLVGAEIPVNAACGGKGTCHKCRVQVVQGFLPKTPQDEKAFKPHELESGWRLSCQARPKVSLEIKVPATQNLKNKPHIKGDLGYWKSQKISPQTHALACDLGSTGVVIALFERANPTTSLEAHLLNRQVVLGADVMTRLQAAQEGKLAELKRYIDSTLIELVDALRAINPGILELLSQPLLCAGNSAMTTFLHAWDFSTLAVSPYQPIQSDAFESTVAKDSLPYSIRAESLPLLAGFVGGDTVAGIRYAESLEKSASARPAPWLFVDIGTNTELVVFDGKDYWVTSAPAGPAFEGGNIFKGMRAENGAISEVHYTNGEYKIKTIGDDLPLGICGSGLMDLIHEGVRGGKISKDGFLEDGEWKITPDISLLADDVREFQLAKSATKTAIDLLLNRVITATGQKPQKLYLAGTFAQFLNVHHIKNLGLIPQDLEVVVLGNASLKGTQLMSLDSPQAQKEFYLRIKENLRPIELALQDDFQEGFVRNLNFYDITK